jgi:hypothetical protein
MRMRRILRARRGSLLLLFLGLFVLTACGSNTSASSSGSGASATATACAQATRPATIGTLQSINGQTLVIANQRGTNVTVTYTSSTRFTQEVAVAASSLQEGTAVRVTVTSSGSTYTATSVIVTTGTTGANSGFPGGFRGNGTPGTRTGRANNPCFTSGRFNRGTPGTGTGTNANFRGLVGTVSQLSGNTLTITDTSGSDYTVTITAQTQIVATKSATAAALKVGQALTVTGTGSQGAIRANLIAILLNLPTRGATATPTP